MDSIRKFQGGALNLLEPEEKFNIWKALKSMKVQSLLTSLLL